ncbi:hypothetical protein H2203_004319 [Taxawa tesnikishii (nom. ined.)]|nr:hypothetical protein H2203_004319 [Dothideales sp. JES 119]
MPQGSATRKPNPLREQLKESRLKTAAKYKCTSGKARPPSSRHIRSTLRLSKWTFLPDRDELARTWRLVAEGVVDGRLGTAATLATLDPTDPPGKSRLVCFYTEDFSNTEDVRRVLKELVETGVAPREGRGIYYRCDAYTYFGTESDNPFGPRASIHYSKDFLTRSESIKERKQQSSLLDAWE